LPHLYASTPAPGDLRVLKLARLAKRAILRAIPRIQARGSGARAALRAITVLLMVFGVVVVLSTNIDGVVMYM
jgi:hypothetical protein